MSLISKNYFCNYCNNPFPKSRIQKHEEQCNNGVNNKNESAPIDQEKEYYGISNGMITFGRPDKSKTIENQEEIRSNQSLNKFKKNIFAKEKKISEKPNFLSKNIENETLNSPSKICQNDINDNQIIPEKFGGVGIVNKINENNSYLNVIVQTIWNLDILRNALLYDLNIPENEKKFQILFNLRDCIIKYSQSLNSKKRNPIEINELRSQLAEIFQSRRKFLYDHPDDPIDAYFVFLNSFHSLFIKKTVNEIHDTSCNFKCLSHKFLWIDLFLREECECKGLTKRFFSFHNYIFEIPLNRILDIKDSEVNIDMDKCAKLKPIKFSQDYSFELSDLKGKLFLYFKILVDQNQSNCPEKGVRCSMNFTKKNFFLVNSPFYLSFSLQNYPFNNIQVSKCENVLKSLVLIPKIFDISTLFETENNRIYYEITGIILKTNPFTSNYSCIFSQKNDNSKEWIYYNDDDVKYFKSYYDAICYLLKNQETPILLIYKKIEERFSMDISVSDNDLTKSQIESLENYFKSFENPLNSMNNQFRPNEQSIPDTDLSQENRKNGNPENKKNLFRKNNSALTQNNVNFAKNINLSENNVNEYNCNICGYKNSIENKYCIKCERKSDVHSSETANIKSDIRLSNRQPNNIINVSKVQNEVSPNTITNRNLEKIKKVLTTINSSNNVASITSITNIELDTIKNSNQLQKSDEEKHLNMPKQISSNSKELKVDKSLKSTIDHNNELELGKREKIDENNYREDRIQPCKSATLIKSSQNLKMKNSTDESDWECDFCKKIHKISTYKCDNCNLINKVVFDLIEKNKLLKKDNPIKTTKTNSNPFTTNHKIQVKSDSKNYGKNRSSDSMSQIGNELKKRETRKNDEITVFSLGECTCQFSNDEKEKLEFGENICKTCKKIRNEKIFRKKTEMINNNKSKSINQNLNTLFNKAGNNQSPLIESKINYFNNNPSSGKKQGDLKVATIKSNQKINNNNFINNNNNESANIQRNESAKKIEIKSNSIDKRFQNDRYGEVNKYQNEVCLIREKSMGNIKSSENKVKIQHLSPGDINKFKLTNDNNFNYDMSKTTKK